MLFTDKQDGSFLGPWGAERCRRTHDTTAPILSDVVGEAAGLDLRRGVWKSGDRFAGD